MAKKAIVVGAGIVGLATARALAIRGYQVTVIERNQRAIGASIRNFGMIWPIGQPDGVLYQTALHSRNIWKELCTDAGIWYDEVGSLHLAYKPDELNVMEEFVSITDKERGCRMLSPQEVVSRSPFAVQSSLLGGLWSPGELIVDPRKAIEQIPVWLKEKYGVNFLWGNAVRMIVGTTVHTNSEQMEADRVFICSGADFETLYPEFFSTLSITRCKLQMMRLQAPANCGRIGPALCGALSLTHYRSFAAAGSLGMLKERINEQYPEYVKWGIHVMASQNQAGEITVGDSHEYGPVHDPFDKQFINQLILSYLQSFVHFQPAEVMQSWHGIYPKMTNGESWYVKEVEPGVTIINGLGGAGMTLSFGLCERLVSMND